MLSSDSDEKVLEDVAVAQWFSRVEVMHGVATAVAMAMTMNMTRCGASVAQSAITMRPATCWEVHRINFIPTSTDNVSVIQSSLGAYAFEPRLQVEV